MTAAITIDAAVGYALLAFVFLALIRLFLYLGAAERRHQELLASIHRLTGQMDSLNDQVICWRNGNTSPSPEPPAPIAERQPKA